MTGILVTPPLIDPVTREDTTAMFSALDNSTTTSTLAVVCFLLGGVALTLNPVIISFYISKSVSVVPALYLSLATSDLITGASSVICGLYFVLKVLDAIEDLNRVRFIWSVFFIASLSIRLSAAYTPILAVVRSINIARPFDRISYKAVLRVVVLVPAIWVVILGLDVWTLAGRIDQIYSANSTAEDSMLTNCFYSSSAGAIYILSNRVNHDGSISYKSSSIYYIVLFLLNLLPFLLPSLLTATCMIHQIYTLAINRRSGPTANTSSKSQHQITISIALLTTTFFVCNSVSIASNFIAIISEGGTASHLEIPVFVLTYLLPFLNSALNPIILILRGAALRTWVVESVRRKVLPGLPISGRSSLKSNITTAETSLAARKLGT